MKASHSQVATLWKLIIVTPFLCPSTSSEAPFFGPYFLLDWSALSDFLSKYEVTGTLRIWDSHLIGGFRRVKQ